MILGIRIEGKKMKPILLNVALDQLYVVQGQLYGGGWREKGLNRMM